jgi:hypothetical protein
MLGPSAGVPRESCRRTIKVAPGSAGGAGCIIRRAADGTARGLMACSRGRPFSGLLSGPNETHPGIPLPHTGLCSAENASQSRPRDPGPNPRAEGASGPPRHASGTRRGAECSRTAARIPGTRERPGRGRGTASCVRRGLQAAPDACFGISEHRAPARSPVDRRGACLRDGESGYGPRVSRTHAPAAGGRPVGADPAPPPRDLSVLVGAGVH